MRKLQENIQCFLDTYFSSLYSHDATSKIKIQSFKKEFYHLLRLVYLCVAVLHSSLSLQIQKYFSCNFNKDRCMNRGIMAIRVIFQVLTIHLSRFLECHLCDDSKSRTDIYSALTIISASGNKRRQEKKSLRNRVASASTRGWRFRLKRL